MEHKSERPILSKEEIKYWINKFKPIDLNNKEQKQRLINVFVNSIYVYDDKMLITFNYKDGDICIIFEWLQKLIKEKQNPNNQNDYQGSPIHGFGGRLPVKSELF